MPVKTLEEMFKKPGDTLTINQVQAIVYKKSFHYCSFTYITKSKRVRSSCGTKRAYIPREQTTWVRARITTSVGCAFPPPPALYFLHSLAVSLPSRGFWKRLLRRLARIVNKSSKKDYEKANKVPNKIPLCGTVFPCRNIGNIPLTSTWRVTAALQQMA